MAEAAPSEKPWVREMGAVLLDKYRLEEPIAAGGMGTVWRAVHTTIERHVAIKFVRAESDRAVERFLREAKIAAAIRSPYVVDMLDFGTSPTGDPFIVMELLDGEALDERMEREPVTTPEAVQILAQLLVGLDAVHRSGIVHRDLKPANAFLSNDGSGEVFARLIDFGISHSLDPTSSLRRGQHGTDERLVVGTPEYIAPEQAEGRPDVDARADVYSAAVMLYEMLCGVVPFRAEHPGTVLYKVMNGGHVSLTVLRPDIPEIAEVVELAMSRDRDRRPQSARDLRRMLLSAAGLVGDVSGSYRAIRTSQPPSVPPPRGSADARSSPTLGIEPELVRPTNPWRLVGLALALVVLSIAVGAFVFGGLPPNEAAPVATRDAPAAAAPVAPEATSVALAPTPQLAPAAPVAPVVEAVVTEEPGRRRRPVRRATGASDGTSTEAETTPAPTAPGSLHRELDF